MRLPAWGAVLLLAACAAPAPPTSPEQETADHRACWDQARNAPDLAALNGRRNPATISVRDPIEAEAQQIRNRVYRDCLRSRGLAAPGGVEPVRRR